MGSLVPCTECHRHVLVSEARCPFCDTALADNVARVSPDTTRRLGRAAAFVFGATVAITACGGDTVVVDDEGTTTSAGGAGGAGGDGGGMQTLYGGPAVGGMGGMGGMGDVGGSAAAYGAPPGGMDPSGSGGFMAEYGAPPPPED